MRPGRRVPLAGHPAGVCPGLPVPLWAKTIAGWQARSARHGARRHKYTHGAQQGCGIANSLLAVALARIWCWRRSTGADRSGTCLAGHTYPAAAKRSIAERAGSTHHCSHYVTRPAWPVVTPTPARVSKKHSFKARAATPHDTTLAGIIIGPLQRAQRATAQRPSHLPSPQPPHTLH